MIDEIMKPEADGKSGSLFGLKTDPTSPKWSGLKTEPLTRELFERLIEKFIADPPPDGGRGIR